MHTSHSFNIWRSIDRLRLDHDIDIHLILDGTSVRRGADLNALELIKIANNLKIDGKSLLSGNFDLERTASILKGNKLSIPTKYEQGMFSSSTSLKNIVNQFKRFGMKRYVLNSIQVDEEYISEHRPLSVHAVNDALDLVKDFICDVDLKNYSKANALDFYNKAYGKIVSEEKTPENVVEAMIFVAHFVERNWDYHFTKKDSGHYCIYSKQSEQMLDSTSRKHFTTANINKMRVYFFYHFMKLCGFKNHEVNIVSQNFDKHSKMIFEVIIKDASFRQHPYSSFSVH